MHILNRIARNSISRRDFLRVSGGVGVGLMVGFDVRAQGSGAAAVMPLSSLTVLASSLRSRAFRAEDPR